MTPGWEERVKIQAIAGLVWLTFLAYKDENSDGLSCTWSIGDIKHNLRRPLDFLQGKGIIHSYKLLPCDTAGGSVFARIEIQPDILSTYMLTVHGSMVTLDVRTEEIKPILILTEEKETPHAEETKA